ncbi:hypothetical protein GWN42_21925, partial [candidate division KSB1 bacterium]|nr:hypothetical protein [candidate division KSB1 bacterium]
MKKRDIYTVVHLHLSGEASKNEQAVLQEWLDASPQNRRLFAWLEKIWQDADPEKPQHTPDISKKWLELESTLDLTRPKSKPPALPWRRSGWRQGVAVAVALMLLFVGTLLYLSFQAAHQ